MFRVANNEELKQENTEPALASKIPPPIRVDLAFSRTPIAKLDSAYNGCIVGKSTSAVKAEVRSFFVIGLRAVAICPPDQTFTRVEYSFVFACEMCDTVGRLQSRLVASVKGGVICRGER